MKVIINIIFNAIGSFLPIAVLQLFVFPELSRIYTSEQYGTVITAISILAVIASGLGISLNNVRLLTSLKYDKNSYNDFIILLLFYGSINILAIACGGMYLKFSTFENLIYIVTSLVVFLKDYFVVLFLLNLDYKKVCIYNILSTFGLITGMFFIKHCKVWQLFYILSGIYPLLYILFCFRKNVNPFKLAKSSFFKSTCKKATSITGAAILNQFLGYADRLLLYPLMGGSVVAVYYISTLVSKIISLCIGPVQGVFLSYISKGYLNKRVSFKSTLVLGIGVGLCVYIICTLSAGPILKILYPDMAVEALKYVGIVTATSILFSINSLLNPFIMKECDNKWPMQLAIENIIVYVISSFILLKIWGLIGFCFANLLTNLYRTIRMYIIYYGKS